MKFLGKDKLQLIIKKVKKIKRLNRDLMIPTELREIIYKYIVLRGLS